jgi:pimeloyl-ACP methyl ester carboxylesterase
VHAELANSQLVEFTASGHLPHLEQPEQFVKGVLGFLKEVNRDRSYAA